MPPEVADALEKASKGQNKASANTNTVSY